MERFLYFVIVLVLVQQAIAVRVKRQSSCPLNEEYNECGTACPVTCDNYNDPQKMCPDYCVEGCECKEEYVRNANGTCCLTSQCPGGVTSVQPEPANEPICPLNEVYTACGSSCPLTCDNYKNPPQICTMDCFVGCQCAEGYVRNLADGSCCKETQCPVCPQNQVFNACGSACPVTCENYKNPPRFCTKQCVSGCQCQTGYIKKSDGSCCKQSECTTRGTATRKTTTAMFKT